MSGLKRHQEAEYAYQHAIALKQDFPSAHFNMARSKLTLAQSVVLPGGLFTSRKARFDGLISAAKHFNMSFDATSPLKNRGETYKSLEETYYAIGDLKASWAAYEKYIELQPNEGLKVRNLESCEQIVPWMVDFDFDLERFRFRCRFNFDFVSISISISIPFRFDFDIDRFRSGFDFDFIRFPFDFYFIFDFRFLISIRFSISILISIRFRFRFRP